jgi:hypothetical protein
MAMRPAAFFGLANKRIQASENFMWGTVRRSYGITQLLSINFMGATSINFPLKTTDCITNLNSSTKMQLSSKIELEGLH